MTITNLDEYFTLIYVRYGRQFPSDLIYSTMLNEYRPILRSLNIWSGDIGDYNNKTSYIVNPRGGGSHIEIGSGRILVFTDKFIDEVINVK